MIRSTEARCKICKHPNREQIEALYLKTYSPQKKGSWQVFNTLFLDSYAGISAMSLRTHFRGNPRKQGMLPHFAVDYGRPSNLVTAAESIEAIESQMEMKGMKVVDRVLTEMEDGTRAVKNGEAIRLVSALQKGRADRKRLDLKEKELQQKDKQFEKGLLAALYGRKPPIPMKVTNAEIIEDAHSGSIQGPLGQ